MLNAETPLLQSKKEVLRRCFNAVFLCVALQFALLSLFVLFMNFHLLHPLQWISQTFHLMVSFSTWLSMLPLLAGVVLYGVVLGKTHLAIPRYHASRFRWTLATGLSKLFSLGTHLLVGLLTGLLYVGFMREDYRHLTYNCYETQCINSRNTFLLAASLAASFCHFVQEHLCTDADLHYPLIHEKRLLQVRAQLIATVRRSLFRALPPTLIFAVCYWLLGQALNRRLARYLEVDMDDSLLSLLSIVGNVRLLVYAWLLWTQIISNMHLMQNLFSIFLLYHMDFATTRSESAFYQEPRLTLIQALGMTRVPIVQHLAAVKLYKLSVSPNTNARQPFFSLSLPGGHPYTWNQLSGQCLSLINAFTEELRNSFQSIPILRSTLPSPVMPPPPPVDPEWEYIRDYNRQHGIRDMTENNELFGTVPQPTSLLKKTKAYMAAMKTAQNLSNNAERLWRHFVATVTHALYSMPGVPYTFFEPEGARTAFVLANADALNWVMQGLAGICAASLDEDRYGIVQMSLAEIIMAILQLKDELDKLTSLNLNDRKSERHLRNLRNGAKRSLYKICSVFQDYLRNIFAEEEDWCRLQPYLHYLET